MDVESWMHAKWLSDKAAWKMEEAKAEKGARRGGVYLVQYIAYDEHCNPDSLVGEEEFTRYDDAFECVESWLEDAYRTSEEEDDDGKQMDAVLAIHVEWRKED